MRTRSFSNLLLSFATCVALIVVTQPASADILKQAANGCFPRVFSQINQFKVSSGGLRNTNSNPRSIVCSVDNDTLGDNATAWDGYIHTQALPDDMDCTVYARAINNGSLVDSMTTTVPQGSSGDTALDGVEWVGLEDYEVYIYIQCAVPGNGRIFGYESEFSS